MHTPLIWVYISTYINNGTTKVPILAKIGFGVQGSTFKIWNLPLTIIYIIFLFLFQSSHLKPTLHCHCKLRHSSRKWQNAITVCFVRFVFTLIPLRCYIILINFFYIINCLIEHNIYRCCRYHRKEGKFILFLEQNLFLWFN